MGFFRFWSVVNENALLLFKVADPCPRNSLFCQKTIYNLKTIGNTFIKRWLEWDLEDIINQKTLLCIFKVTDKGL